MLRTAYRVLSLWGLVGAIVRGPFYVLRFLLRAFLIREIVRWT
jgi:hypothetical protein